MSRPVFAPARSLVLLTAAGLVGCTHPPANPPGHERAPVHPAPHARHGAHRAPSAHHRFQDAEAWAKRFDDPARDDWQRPNEVLDALGLVPDHRVADIGSGTGYFAVRIAERVPQGIVYGADIEPDMTAYLRRRAAAHGHRNVRALTVAPDAPHFPERLDRVLIVNTYHHLKERVRYLERLKASLQEGAQVVVVDFRKKPTPMGPPLHHRLTPSEVTAEFAAAGYERLAHRDSLPHQYILTFRRRATDPGPPDAPPSR